MQIKPLRELLTDIEKEMLRLGYTEGSIKFYRRRWKLLIEFAEKKKENYFSEKLGLEFIEKYFPAEEVSVERVSQPRALELPQSCLSVKSRIVRSSK